MAERLLHRDNSQSDFTFNQLLRSIYDKLEYLSYRYIYERPTIGYRRRLSKLISAPSFKQHTQYLLENGILILPSYFSGENLDAMRSDFDSWCKTKLPEAKGLTHFDGAVGESYLKTSISLSSAAIDPYITAVAGYYWGKPIKLAYARGYRTEPIPPEEYRAFQWHHDLKRKQIKVMILLTDVPPDGQRMDYIPKTHQIWHEFKSQRDTVFSTQKALSYGNVIPCSGPAGTVIIFDTNGLHRGNRNLGPRRDQYTFNYTAGKSIFPLPGLHPQVIKSLNEHQKRIARIEESNIESHQSLKIQAIKNWFVDSFLLDEW